jgi:hypothetical protein
MRFFVPLSNDPDHAEHLYESIRHRLKETREPSSERRIYVLKFQGEEGKRLTIAVGGQVHGLSDEPVLAIFRGLTTATYYVCTPKHGAFEGQPYAIPEEASVEVEEFSALR